jgi:probable O-glycosylation ligase (exosortase A-associated)
VGELILMLVILGALPLVLVRPHYGVLLWFWIGLMNPHRLVGDVSPALRPALIAGGVTLVAWAISREPKSLSVQAPVVLLGMIAAWVTLTTIVAIRPDLAWITWQEVMKMFLMTFVTMVVIYGRERILQLVWIIVLSIGFWGVYSGLIAVATGGTQQINGPPNSSIADNNALALALVMVIPLMRFLQTIEPRRVIRIALMAAMGLTVIGALATYSRGGLLALAIVLPYLWLKLRGRERLVTMLGAASVLVLVFTFAPEQWFERMATIGSYDQDASAIGRLNSWLFSYRLAHDHPITGGGFSIFNDEYLYLSYTPEAVKNLGAHSIYFQMLGEHGYVGLGIYLALLASTLLTARSVMRRARGDEKLRWAGELGAMLQVSVIGYAVAGAFLNLAFFDLYYALVALAVVTRAHVTEGLAPEGASRKPRPAVQAPVTPRARTPIIYSPRRPQPGTGR